MGACLCCCYSLCFCPISTTITCISLLVSFFGSPLFYAIYPFRIHSASFLCVSLLFLFPRFVKGTTTFQECNRCNEKGAEFVCECDGSVRLLNWSRLRKRTWSYLLFPLFSVLLGESSSSSMYHVNDLRFVFLNNCKCL